jgi:hypothetical protein
VYSLARAAFLKTSNRIPEHPLPVSTAPLNVCWGAANFLFAYLLLVRVGKFEIRSWRHVLVAAAGGLAMALMLARHFGRFYGGL